MKDLRVRKVFSAHLNLDHKHKIADFTEKEQAFHHSFQDHFQEVLNQKALFSDDVEHFLDQVVQNEAILEPIVNKKLEDLESQSLQAYHFFVQQPSENIQAKLYQVHVVFSLLMTEYGNLNSLKLLETLWTNYVVKSKLQHDLAALLYDISLRKSFALSHQKHQLHTAKQVQDRTSELKYSLRDILKGLKKTETLGLVIETLDRTLD